MKDQIVADPKHDTVLTKAGYKRGETNLVTDSNKTRTTTRYSKGGSKGDVGSSGNITVTHDSDSDETTWSKDGWNKNGEYNSVSGSSSESLSKCC